MEKKKRLIGAAMYKPKRICTWRIYRERGQRLFVGVVDGNDYYMAIKIAINRLDIAPDDWPRLIAEPREV